MPKDPRSVIQYDLEGNTIQKFSSASQAAKTLLVKETLIRASLYDKKKKVMGKWRFLFAPLPTFAVEVRQGGPGSGLPSTNIQSPPAVEHYASFAGVIASVTPEMIKPPTDQDLREVFADLSQNSDRWLTPFEKIINRRDSNPQD